jgi:alkylation response protein AidB-like acyl-CoA dehydrogenase
MKHNALEEQNIIELKTNIKQTLKNELFKINQNENLLPRHIFNSFAEIGITGVAISENFDGSALIQENITSLVEEIATVDMGCAVFFSVHCMTCGIVNKFATNEQSKKWLPSLAKGLFLGAFALTEPNAGSDAANLSTTFQETNNSFILNGEKCYITSAGFADIYIIFARKTNTKGSEGITAFIIDTSQKKSIPGLIFGKPEKKMGAELSPIASLSCQNLHLSKDALLGKIGEGYKIALSGLAGGRVNMAACANGISRSAIELALSYSMQRIQFGKKIFDFQALQFMLADMQIKLTASQALTKQASNALDKDPNSSESRILPSIAKCYATDSAMEITTNAVQILGGAGYIKDFKVEQLMRDAKMLQIVEGTNQIQRHIIAKEMSAKEMPNLYSTN